ncbi:dihydropteroate synthase [Mesorhizobium sp. CAU 1741]|uniref:dihydropteroate synthase n=1 Tax=Mesorhizobium sp. CAU 1741 TaxID=3140366 RepID=UPI00325B4878
MFAPVTWPLAHGRSLLLGQEAVVMGVLNVTPDSFSDGGKFNRVDAAIAQAEAMIRDGAAIIDVGGESTRPGAAAVTAAEEQARVMPLIEVLGARGDVVVSVDTYREETARLAVAAGAHIVNDVWGLQREPGIARVAAETGAGLVVMHTGRDRERLEDPIADQMIFLRRSLEIARDAGVLLPQIVLDPGFGFAKETTEINLDIMARFTALHDLGRPLLVGTSRKRFIGSVTGRQPEQRGSGTAATSVILRLQGAAIFRVHDVAINVDALRFADAMVSRGLGAGTGRAYQPQQENGT